MRCSSLLRLLHCWCGDVSYPACVAMSAECTLTWMDFRHGDILLGCFLACLDILLHVLVTLISLSESDVVRGNKGMILGSIFQA